MKLYDKETYFGFFVEEAIKDPTKLNKLDIKFTHVEINKNSKDSKQLYHVYGVLMTGEFIEKLSKLIHYKWHYAKFFHNDETIMVYPNKIFVINEKTNEGYEEAYNYGKKLEIGDEHLNNILRKTKITKEMLDKAKNESYTKPQEKSFIDKWEGKVK